MGLVVKRVAASVIALTILSACGVGSQKGPAPVADNAVFIRLATDILEDYFRRHPATATDLGIHTYDGNLEDYSREAVAGEVQALRTFRGRLDGIDPVMLARDQQLDREQLLHALDSRILT